MSVSRLACSYPQPVDVNQTSVPTPATVPPTAEDQQYQENDDQECGVVHIRLLESGRSKVGAQTHPPSIRETILRRQARQRAWPTQDLEHPWRGRQRSNMIVPAPSLHCIDRAFPAIVCLMTGRRNGSVTASKALLAEGPPLAAKKQGENRDI